MVSIARGSAREVDLRPRATALVPFASRSAMGTPSTTKFSFKKRAARYQPVNAYWMSCASGLVYSDAGELTRALKTWGFSRVNVVSRGSTQCVIANDGKMALVSFRGTETDQIGDVLADLEFTQRSAHGGRVHSGFYRAYAQVRSRVRSQVAAHVADGQTLWIAGHSLGGALATLAAIDLCEQGRTVHGVYTYGQPHVGDASFRDHYNKQLRGRHYRIANVNDLVPNLPLRKTEVDPIDTEYSHVGAEILIAPGDRLTLQYRRSRNILNQFKSVGEALPCHAWAGYIRAMMANIDKSPFDAPDTVLTEGGLLTPEEIAAWAKGPITDFVSAASSAGSGLQGGAQSVGDAIESGVKSTRDFFKKLF